MVNSFTVVVNKIVAVCLWRSEFIGRGSYFVLVQNETYITDMGDTDFNELLQAAEQLSAEVEGIGDLPKVERSLQQVLEASTELWSRATQDGAQEIQAQLLLSSKGVDLPQLSQKLDTLSTRKTFESLEPIPDVDVQKYLKNEAENAILSVIEEVHKTCSEDLECDLWDYMQHEWKLQKHIALNGLIACADESLDVTVQPEISIIDDGVSGRIRSLLDDQEMMYAKHVIEYNEALLKGTIQPSLIEKLCEASKSFGDKKTVEMWEMVKYISQLPPQAIGEPYLMRSSPLVQTAMISQARKYLQDRYQKYMTSVVMSSLQYVQRGGIPGIYTLVKSFVAITVPKNMPGLEDGEVDGQPLWPLIYYCLRCGDAKAAMHCAQQGQNMEEFTSVLEEFSKSSDMRLSPRLEQLIRVQYRRLIRNSTDPFKRAVYCVIGACDVNDEHPDIAKTADDYLWLKLCQVRNEDNSEPGTDKLTYTYLQTLILQEYGETHYNAVEHPHVYFQVLFLTGQFEAALEFLSRIQKLRVHAVHIAIALNEQGLLSTPTQLKASLLTVDPNDRPPARRLNITRLIMLYASKFENTDVKEALYYYYFLRNKIGPEGENVFISCISDLALATREFNLILGYVRPDGCRIPGLIENFQTMQNNTKDITGFVAADCEKKAYFEDAIRLYDLAENHEKVFSLMVQLLRPVVHHRNTPGSLRARLQDLAHSISNRYAGQHYTCSSQTASMFFTMRDLLSFFNFYHHQNYQQAFEIIQKSKLIPLSPEERKERLLNFKYFSEDLTYVIPHILLATMDILFRQYKKLRGDETRSIGIGKYEDREKQLSALREKAQEVSNFAGNIPHHVSSDTLSKLTQMHVLMN